jgi:hypothetical protein
MVAGRPGRPNTPTGPPIVPLGLAQNVVQHYNSNMALPGRFPIRSWSMIRSA